MKDLKEIEELKRYVAKKAIEWADVENTCSKEHHDLYRKISFLMDVINTIKNTNK